MEKKGKKQDKSHFYRYYNDTYGITMCVTFGTTPEWLSERFTFNDSPDSKCEPISPSCDAFVEHSVTNIAEKYYGILVWFKDRKSCTANVMCHESFHIMNRIMRLFDLTLNDDPMTNEHLAYLSGWIAERIDRAKQGLDKKYYK